MKKNRDSMKNRDKRDALTHNFLGMFDAVKGIGMLLIIYGHTASNYGYSEKAVLSTGLITFLALLLMVLGEGLMPAFFMMSGYGFRKQEVKKCVFQQISFVIKPYLITAMGTTILNFATRFIVIRSWKGALIEASKVATSFLLALPESVKIGGIQLYSIGTMWYLVALFIGWILLNVLLSKVQNKFLPVLVVIMAGIGCWIGRGRIIPFCLSQGLVCTLYLYIGYRIKKGKYLFKKMSVKMWFPIIVSFLIEGGAVLQTGTAFNMANGIYPLQIVSALVAIASGWIWLKGFIQLNRFHNPLINILQIIGRNSFYIFSLHTVELHGIPWYLFAQQMQENPVIGCILQFVFRVAFIAAGTILIKNRHTIFEYIGKRYKELNIRR